MMKFYQDQSINLLIDPKALVPQDCRVFIVGDGEFEWRAFSWSDVSTFEKTMLLGFERKHPH